MSSESSKFSSTPVFRYLRGYSIDPSLAIQLESAPVSQVLFKIPWEEKLEPGPVGEYLEVIDYDPMSKCFYEPVNLNDPNILAQDGLPPSEGTPQFHQQMVYAVAQLTIHNFEHALGRRTLWAPSANALYQDQDLNGFVPQLRIYPHALRDANAYYSPAKKSLLFGYFLASESDTGGEHTPGGMVFTCLSHDIIAHETTHALLDGLHRRFNRATNPDMLAFHEAFADLVALFQHFTFPEILEHQISKTRGFLTSQETLLSQLAGQFGRATGGHGALRDAIGKYENGIWRPRKPDPTAYKTTSAPHELGSILVAAIFDAFLSIYSGRIADLMRIYTGGSGVLPEGDIHPDLVARLSNEASKTANHVLSMCVRALDYCPPMDLTFGEYLRALITADIDLVPEDDLNYRVAFVEAFRKRGLYPRNLRTLSVENLVWRSPDHDEFKPSPKLNGIFELLRIFSQRQLYASDRKELFRESARARKKLYDSLNTLLKQEVEVKNIESEILARTKKRPDEKEIASELKARIKKRLDEKEIASELKARTGKTPDGKKIASEIKARIQKIPDEMQISYDCEFLGLTVPKRKVEDGQNKFEMFLFEELFFKVESLHFAGRTGPDGDLLLQAIVQIIQEGELNSQPMEGGCTLIVDLKKTSVAYSIRKSISTSRQAREKEYFQGITGTTLRETYYGSDDSRKQKEPFALLHRSGS